MGEDFEVHGCGLLNRHLSEYFLTHLAELFQVHMLCSAKLKNDCEPEDLEGSGPSVFPGVISAFS